MEKKGVRVKGRFEPRGQSRDVGRKTMDWDRIKVICLIFLSFVTILFICRVTRSILIPFMIGVFLYYAMTPLVDWFQYSLKLPRFLSLVLSIFSALLVAGLIVFLIVVSFNAVLHSLEQYRLKTIELISAAAAWVNPLTQPLGFDADISTVTEYLKSLPVLSYARSFSSGLLVFLGQTFLTVTFFMFLVAGTGVKRGPGPKPESVAFKVNEKIARYIAAKFLIALITGSLTALTLFLLGIDMALLFGLFAFLLDFIPSIGAPISMILPLPIALLQHGVGLRLILALALPWAVQTVLGSIIEPRIMGDSLGLHPVVVLLSLLLWGFIWGIPGMFMAVPITAVIKIILARHEITQGFARILEGRIYSM